ncbi:cell division/cell wall cluster transcriptional repressor MraZ [Candidatus Kaiserbacteria bacterium RIFCSPHIGHO2_01_FULL_54_36]|uniref:Transcriptional regulator MraZ n=1 Tax=Candidatus Kaiserbacteria bacterium RIFCSPHIGHO2_01_FULL_54_36 TaxID=1798482 RepID=A0A1F6CMA3_9BACT|nr:MAG: cell division/cell wall cluster transcriptional repressor MraZ [Candidatus Kaiserbacteria bacterium RIFCSPHIGHO2_01_FULL_54_36]OGG75711.1 MAG: cell division/cell wall cluster transcriptional repressor MraZ [Candidatus Kaiserbacteria bacterium RIFCSPLOWO2_01_FULL_54_22]
MTNLLIGEYEHTLDEKKRISLPKAFRTGLGKRVVMTRGLDNCLFVFSREAWDTFAMKMQSLSFANADTRGFNRFMLSGAAEVDVDGVGRILIPDHQKSFAGLRKRVVFTGVSDRVEIWDAERWGTYKRKIDRNADKLAQKLGEIGAL